MKCKHLAVLFLAFLFIVSVVSSQFPRVQAAQQVKLFGYVTEEEEVPIKNICVTVTFHDQDGALFQNTHTDENGYYELTVPHCPSYEFFVEGRECGDPYLFNYIPTKKKVFVDKLADVQVDFRLKPATNIILHAYDNDGNLLRNKDFREATIGEAFATNPNDLPHYAVYYPIHDSYSISIGPKGNLDLAVPAFIVLPQTPYKIHILWEVPGFGKVILSADNEGDGYSLESQGEELILDFNYEAAKSNVATLQRDYKMLKSQGYSISSSVAEGLNLGNEHLRSAEEYLLKTSAPNMKSAVAELNLSLQHSLLAHEQLYLDRAEADIERYRKGDAKIKVVGEAGELVGDCSISFKQTSHDFLFASRLVDRRCVGLLRLAGINCTNSDSFYGKVEPELGRFEWGSWDNDVKDKLDDGFKLIGNLGWLFFHGWGNTRDLACPRYLDDMSFQEVKEAVYNHMHKIANRYNGKIDIWNAIYETCGAWANAFNWTWNQKLEIFKAATSAIKTANPEARILSKDYGLPYTRYMSWDCYKPADLDTGAGWIPFSEFITLATEKQIPIDIIGLEIPGSGVDMYQTGSPNIHPALDLVFISTLLDQYSKFDKSIFILGYKVPSIQVEGSCWWHRPWDEQTQAEYVEQVYTIAFSKPLVKGIQWEGVADDPTHSHGAISSGLFDADLKPKPSYFALKNLIESWTTTGTGNTDEKGEFEFRGFAGNYDITLINPDGHSCKTRIHISEDYTKVTIAFTPTEQEDAECTISAVSHITPPEPAAFSVSDLITQPAQAQPHEAVTIMISVANTGGTEGTYSVVLKINGVEEAEESSTY